MSDCDKQIKALEDVQYTTEREYVNSIHDAIAANLNVEEARRQHLKALRAVFTAKLAKEREEDEKES